MKNRLSSFVSLSLLPLLTIGMLLQPAPAAAAGGDAEDRETRARLEAVRAKINELRAELEGARDRQTRLREQLRSSELAIGEASRSLRELRQKQQKKAAELDELQTRREQASEQLERHRRLLEEQIIASYAMGRQGYLKMILNQQDPATLGRMLAYYNLFHRARADQIAVVNNRLEEIDSLEQAISRERDELDRLHAEQTRQIDRLEASRRSRADVLAKLDVEIQTRQQTLDRLLQDERSLSELVDELREAIAIAPGATADLQPFPALKGQLPWPVDGKIANRFGTQRTARSLPWRGVVIAAAEGSEVRAIHSGQVVFADWIRGFGLLVIIDHGRGYMSLYGYNQSLYKKVGDRVTAGEIIATVGDSGGRDEPGLYFEIRHNGQPDNPMQWCRAAAR